MINDIFLLYKDGEIIPYIILAIVSVGYIIIFEKFILLQLVYRINFEKFNTQIKKMLAANDMDRARNFSKATSKTSVPMLTVKAIEAYETDPSRVRATISEESLRFFPRIRRRLNQLPHLAATCVILGAVATVHGVWASFHMAEGLELGIKSFTFSSGLSQALLPLAIALVAAALLMLPFGLLDAIAWRLESEIEHSLCVILNILSPEMLPIFSASSSANQDSGGQPHENNVNQNTSGHSASNASSEGAAETPELKGRKSTDESNSSTSQHVPDEEEII